MLIKVSFARLIIGVGLVLSSLLPTASAGSRTSNGGDLILIQHSNGYYHSYSLDLIDMVCKIFFIDMRRSKHDVLLEGYRSFERSCRSDGLYGGESRYNIETGCKVVFFDTPDLSVAKMLREKQLISNLLFETVQSLGSSTGWLKELFMKLDLLICFTKSERSLLRTRMRSLLKFRA